MFEDIIGGVENKRDSAQVIYNGDGVVSCPSCGSDNISKGQPVYLLTKNTQQRCECRACTAVWSLNFDPVSKKYKFVLHARVVI